MKGARRKPSAAKQIRPFWVLLLVLGVAAGAIGAFIVAWPGFAPKQVSVTGNRVVPAAEIAARARVEPRVNMWLQNTGSMEARVRAIPYIASAAVYRVPPATVVIAVRERAPFAVMRSGDASVLVDRDLRVLGEAYANGSLPVFVVRPGVVLEPGNFVNDTQGRELRDDYDAMIAAHVVPLELSFDRFGGLVATVRGGVRILLGDDSDFQKKLALVNPVLSQLVHDRRRVAAVDLRAPSTPVLVWRK